MAVGQIYPFLGPGADSGASCVSSASAWVFGSPVTMTFDSPPDLAVVGFRFQNTSIPVVDVNQNILFEIIVGGLLLAQVPFNMKANTLVGYNMTSGSSNTFFFPEPFLMPGAVSVAYRVADSIAAALTYNGVKLLIQEMAPFMPPKSRMVTGTAIHRASIW